MWSRSRSKIPYFPCAPLLRDPLLEREHGRRPLRLFRRRDRGLVAADARSWHAAPRRPEPTWRRRGQRSWCIAPVRARTLLSGRLRREVRHHGGHVAARGLVLGYAEGERAHDRKEVEVAEPPQALADAPSAGKSLEMALRARARCAVWSDDARRRQDEAASAARCAARIVVSMRDAVLRTSSVLTTRSRRSPVRRSTKDLAIAAVTRASASTSRKASSEETTALRSSERKGRVSSRETTADGANAADGDHGGTVELRQPEQRAHGVLLCRGRHRRLERVHQRPFR